jgi:hypothetical protein
LRRLRIVASAPQQLPSADEPIGIIIGIVIDDNVNVDDDDDDDDADDDDDDDDVDANRSKKGGRERTNDARFFAVESEGGAMRCAPFTCSPFESSVVTPTQPGAESQPSWSSLPSYEADPDLGRGPTSELAVGRVSARLLSLGW